MDNGPGKSYSDWRFATTVDCHLNYVKNVHDSLVLGKEGSTRFIMNGRWLSSSKMRDH